MIANLADKYSKQKLKKEDEYVNRNADPRFRKELRRELYNIDNQILVFIV